jgi:hypothetical protein
MALNLPTTNRNATAPLPGAGRDAFAVGFFTWAAAKAAMVVTARSGDPELGEMAGEAITIFGPGTVAILAGTVTGFFTLGRKWLAERS